MLVDVVVVVDVFLIRRFSCFVIGVDVVLLVVVEVVDAAAAAECRNEQSSTTTSHPTSQSVSPTKQENKLDSVSE